MICDRKRKFSGGALSTLFASLIFILTFTKIGDTETWLHLSLGRIIWQIKAVPYLEPFTYPILEEPFSYNSWLFGLLTYGLNSNFGAYGLVLLKASVIAAAFYVLLRDSLRPYSLYSIAMIVLLTAAIISQYRFVMRPDMFLMLFLAFSIFSLNAYLYDNKKYIYALPLVHLLWANMHASIIVMFVPFSAFIAGSILHRYLGRKGIDTDISLSNSQLKVLAIVFAASFAATLMTPYFSFHQYFYGPKYLTSGWHTQTIIEMLPPEGLARILLYGVVIFISTSFLIIRNRISFIHLLLVVPFMVLPFTSIRFQFLIAIVGGPVLARNISSFVQDKKWNLFDSRAAIAISALLLTLYCYHSVTGFVKQNIFGFGFDYSMMPKGAVEYMDRKGIYGKVFNPFHFGQYIIWTGYPKRTVFTDARGHLPGDLLTAMQEARYSPPLMDSLSEQYGFEAVLLDRPKFPPNVSALHGKADKSFDHPGWALVYWDDNSFLYLKKNGAYASIIKEDEYRFMRPLAPLSSFMRSLNSENTSGYRAELDRNIKETNSASAHIFLSLLHLTNGDYKDAIREASTIKEGALITTSYIVRGDSYRELGDMKLSLYFYKMALDINEIPGLYFRAGSVSRIMGDNEEAIRYFGKALELDASMAAVYPELIDAYLDTGMQKEANEATRKYQSLKQGK